MSEQVVFFDDAFNMDSVCHAKPDILDEPSYNEIVRLGTAYLKKYNDLTNSDIKALRLRAGNIGLKDGGAVASSAASVPQLGELRYNPLTKDKILPFHAQELQRAAVLSRREVSSYSLSKRDFSSPVTVSFSAAQYHQAQTVIQKYIPIPTTNPKFGACDAVDHLQRIYSR